MRLQHLFTLATVFSLSSALELTNGVLRATNGDQTFSVDKEATNDPVLFDSTDSYLEISFDLKSATKRIPDQIFIKLTNNDGVETSFKPITKVVADTDADEQDTLISNKFSLTYSKLPKVFAASSYIDIALVAGDVSDNTPIFTTIGKIQLTETLASQAGYTKAKKFGAQPEIHHVFHTSPDQVNSVVALTFAALSIGCLAVLIGAWGVQGSLNFKNFPGVTDVSHLSFIGLIIGYEVVFFQYYLGSTIFQTIFKILVLLGPSLWFGSKVLNHVGSLRLAGKR